MWPPSSLELRSPPRFLIIACEDSKPRAFPALLWSLRVFGPYSSDLLSGTCCAKSAYRLRGPRYFISALRGMLVGHACMPCFLPRALPPWLASVCPLVFPVCPTCMACATYACLLRPATSVTASAIILSGPEVQLTSWQNPSVGARMVTCCGFIRLTSRPNSVGGNRSSVSPSRRGRTRTNSLVPTLVSTSLAISLVYTLFISRLPLRSSLSAIPLSWAWGGSVVGGVGLLVPPPVRFRGFLPWA